MYTHPPCLRTCLVRTSKEGNNFPSNVFFDVVKLLMFLSFNALGSLFIRILLNNIEEIFSLEGHVVNWIYPLAWLITDT